MEILDTDILSYDELEMDFMIINRPCIKIKCDGRLIRMITVRDKESAYKLCQQIEQYRKELEDGRDKEGSS